MKIVGEGISKYYRNGKVATKGIDGVDISIDDGDFALLVGPSGSGKSTLAKILSLRISYDEGDIYFDGKKEFSLTEKERRGLKAFDIAYVSPNDSFIESLSPLDNILLQASGAYGSKRELRKEAKKALISLGLEKVMHRKVSLLSGGERDRTTIALSLVLPASVFFFDEPLSDLNGSLKEICLNKIIEKTKGKTVVFITHDPELIEPYATCSYRMEEGKIASRKELKEKENVAPKRGKKGETRGFSPFSLFRGKTQRTLLSIGLCLLLGVFLTVLGNWGFSIYRDNVSEEKYSYSFSNRFPNRLLVVGEGPSSHDGIVDTADLFGDVYVIGSYLDEDGRSYALPSSSIQPVIPDGSPTKGEKGQEGIYLLISRSRYEERSASFAYIENAVGKTVTVYDYENYHRKTQPCLAEAAFRGYYVLDDSSFYLGSDYSLCASEGTLEEMRNSLLDRLNGECETFEEVDVPLYDSGGSSNQGLLLKGEGKMLSSLSDSDFSLYPAAYASSSGEELPPGKIYLPSDMEGEEFSFTYKGKVINSNDVADYLCYMGWPLKNGEWHAPSPVLRKISLELDLERSVYFPSPEEMDRYEAETTDAVYRHGDSKILQKEASLDTMNTVWLLFMGIAALAFCLLSSWLLRKVYKAREEDERILIGRGYSHTYISMNEGLSYGILTFASLAICFVAYFLWIGDASPSANLIMVFVMMGVFALIAAIIPIGKKKSRRI